MPLEPKKYLYDIQEAASRIVDFTSGKTLDDCAKAEENVPNPKQFQ
jgi:uncharacterized protein with HEPN domain